MPVAGAAWLKSKRGLILFHMIFFPHFSCIKVNKQTLLGGIKAFPVSISQIHEIKGMHKQLHKLFF